MSNEQPKKPRVQPPKANRLKRWSKEFLTILVIVGVISFAMDFYHSRNLPQERALPIQGITIDGKPVDVIELSKNGQPVIVYFWATWCGACKLVSPTVNYFSDSHQVVSVALSSGSDQRVQQFIEAKGYQFPVLNDANGQISRDWGINVTPTIVIIKDGEISSVTSGVTTPIGLWFRHYFA